VLRDGFALTVTDQNPAFAEVAAEGLRQLLRGRVEDVEAAVGQVMSAFGELPVHPDVVEGVQLLHRLGIQLVTLSNGSTSVARGLLQRNRIADSFTALMSVEDAPLWKPAREAYLWALGTRGVEPTDAMLVAVHPWDVHGAHHAGLGTAWLNRSGAAYPAGFHVPDLEADSLVDLAAQLGAVAG
jgi:2-haloacid dehalogenase